MVRIRHLLVAGAAVAALVPVAGNAGPSPSCDSTLTQEVAGTYVDVRDPSELGIWIYQESNGIAGLQKGGVGDLSDDSACAEYDGAGNPIPPDTLIF